MLRIDRSVLILAPNSRNARNGALLQITFWE